MNEDFRKKIAKFFLYHPFIGFLLLLVFRYFEKRLSTNLWRIAKFFMILGYLYLIYRDSNSLFKEWLKLNLKDGTSAVNFRTYDFQEKELRIPIRGVLVIDLNLILTNKSRIVFNRFLKVFLEFSRYEFICPDMTKDNFIKIPHNLLSRISIIDENSDLNFKDYLGMDKHFLISRDKNLIKYFRNQGQNCIYVGKNSAELFWGGKRDFRKI